MSGHVYLVNPRLLHSFTHHSWSIAILNIDLQSRSTSDVVIIIILRTRRPWSHDNNYITEAVVLLQKCFMWSWTRVRLEAEIFISPVDKLFNIFFLSLVELSLICKTYMKSVLLCYEARGRRDMQECCRKYKWLCGQIPHDFFSFIEAGDIFMNELLVVELIKCKILLDRKEMSDQES